MARDPERNKAIVLARLEEEQRYKDSGAGMQVKAAALRQRATQMGDSNDRDAMLRLADGYEQRAKGALRRPKSLAAGRAAISPSRTWPRNWRRGDSF